MVFTHKVVYHKPSSIGATLELLTRHGEKASILAGGTDLTLQLKEDRRRPDALVDIKGLGELNRLELKDGRLFIGALVTFSTILKSTLVREHFPILCDAAHTVASPGIRNRATLVGNICSAVPSLDSAPPLFCYDATVHVQGVKDRDIAIHDWFISPRKSALCCDELVTGVSLPLVGKPHAGCYVKLGRYAGEDLAQAGIGILVTKCDIYKVAHTAVAMVPGRARSVEELLNGKQLTAELIIKAQAAMMNETAPISDIRASKEYRQHMLQVMLERGLYAAKARLRGEQIDVARILGG